MALFKTTLVIWTNYNPVTVELEDLAMDVVNEEALLQQHTYEIVPDQDVPNEVKSFSFPTVEK